MATLRRVDAARVLAMAAIFLFHLWSVVPDGVGSGWASRALSQGYLGVVVFNVITGLVLAWPHLGPAQRPFPTWRNFLRRRFLRIVPAYYLALGLWVGVAALVAGGSRAPATASVVTHLLFAHTLSPADFFAIVPAYWWLGLLAQLYLAFPPLLRFQAAIKPWRGVAVVCATSWGSWLILDAIARVRPGSTVALVNYMGYYNLPYRLPEFAIGVGLADSLRSASGGRDLGLQPWSAIALLGACSLLAALPAALPESVRELAPIVHLRLVAVCVALFVLLLALPAGARVGSGGPVASAARASYAFYLLHQPMLGYGADVLAPLVGERLAAWLLLIGGSVVTYQLSLVLDHVASTLVERLRTETATDEPPSTPPRGP